MTEITNASAEMAFFHVLMRCGSLSAAARELGLTPASLQRMRLVVEAPEPVHEPGPDPYAHLMAVK